jgi:hypothetical protein
MPAKKKAVRSWTIFRMRGPRLVVLGVIHAPDEATALDLAAEQFSIPLELRNRLVAKTD